ncbi:MAG: hypothetical protein QM758_19310 [Armatimonas sp.]
MPDDSTPRRRFSAITRREALGWLGGLIAAPAGAKQGRPPIVIKPNGGQPPIVLKPGGGLIPGGIIGANAAPGALPGLPVVRADDLLNVSVELVNLSFTGSGAGRKLQRTNTKPGDAFVVLHFPPQHIAEQTLPETNAGLPPAPAQPLKSLLASNSRVAFAVPANISSLPGNLEELLTALRAMPLTFSASATAAPPVANQTAIEVVYGLTISPLSTENKLRFVSAPVTLSGRTNLFTARFDGGTHGLGQFWRAVVASGGSPPFDAPLTLKDRQDLVALTGDAADVSAGRRIEAETLTLSALGAWSKLRYEAEPPPGSSLEAWTQHANMGRDQFVRVVRKGYLLPFGHRVSFVTISERKFLPSGSGAVATLVKRQFLIIRERERTFPTPNNAYTRVMPFRRVRIDIPQTPLLDPTWVRMGWPMVEGKDFRFPVTAWDDEGREVHFDLPMLFASADAGTAASTGPNIPTAIARYNTPPAGPDANKELLRHTGLPMGQKMSFAPASKPGDTAYETASLVWAVAGGVQQGNSILALPAAPPPGFVPVLFAATVALPGAQELYGKPVPLIIGYDELYIKNGFGGQVNVGEVLLRSATAVPLKLPGDTGGGLAAPNYTLTHLSRKLGPVAGKALGGGKFDVANIAKGTFNPTEYFGSVLDAKLLGTLTLGDLLNGITGILDDAPKMVRQEFPDKIEITQKWVTTRLPDKKLVFEKRGGCELALVATATTPISLSGPGTPTLTFSAALKNFDLALFGVVRLPFNVLSFSGEVGKKLDVVADMGQLQFGGPLAFINEVRKYIPASGFSDPPSLDISPSGVTVGYSLELPTVGVGVMTFENMALGAALTIPFTGQPVRFRFHFCERERPFHIICSFLGGGGFFALDIGADGIERIEASLEFGGGFSINLGVAAGAVSAMVGVYMVYTLANGGVELTGYVRIRGSLSILGIITISLEFYLALTYNSADGSAWGEASVKVEIEILFFSKTVSVTARRQFAGGKGTAMESLPERHYAALELEDGGFDDAEEAEFGQPPVFKPANQPKLHTNFGALRTKDILTTDQWTKYCKAFA